MRVRLRRGHTGEYLVEDESPRFYLAYAVSSRDGHVFRETGLFVLDKRDCEPVPEERERDVTAEMIEPPNGLGGWFMHDGRYILSLDPGYRIRKRTEPYGITTRQVLVITKVDE